jgi:hypothetical protein
VTDEIGLMAGAARPCQPLCCHNHLIQDLAQDVYLVSPEMAEILVSTV